jgi:hypothetical protein
MATSTITALTAAGALAGTEPIETVQGGVSKKTTVAAIAGLATAATVGLGSVTNDAQTKAAIVPNTAPAAGALLVGNAGATAYASVAMSGDATLSSAGALTIGNAKVTLAKIANAGANSVLVGAGSAGTGASYSEVTLGTGLTMTGTVLSSSATSMPSGTFASKPGSPTTGQLYLATDIGGDTPGVMLIYSGTRWKPLGGRARLKTLGAPVTGLTNSESISLQASLPAGLLAVNDVVEVWSAGNKSGTTDTYNTTIRLGTAGTTADTAIQPALVESLVASLSFGTIYAFKITAATTSQRIGNSGGTSAANIGGSYGGGNAGAQAAGVTISNVSNALFLSVALVSGGATNTIGLYSGYIDWCTP